MNEIICVDEINGLKKGKTIYYKVCNAHTQMPFRYGKIMGFEYKPIRDGEVGFISVLLDTNMPLLLNYDLIKFMSKKAWLPKFKEWEKKFIKSTEKFNKIIAKIEKNKGE